MPKINSHFPKVDEKTVAGAGYVPKLRNRSLAQIEQDRADLLARSPKPRPLPPGKTLEDVIVGQWPGDETDEEIMTALAELS